MRSWNENLKKWAIVLTIVFLLPAVWLLVAGSTSRRRIDAKWLLKDFQRVEEMIGEHVDPYWRTPKEGFEEVIEKARSSIKRMHRMDFYLVAQKVMALLQDHESYVHFGMPDYMPVLPFKLRFRDGKLFVYDSIDGEVKDGSVVEEFNGMGIEKLLNWVGEYVGGESEEQFLRLAEDFLFKYPSIFRKESVKVKIGGRVVKVYCTTIAKYSERLKEKKKSRDFKLVRIRGVPILKLRTLSLWGQDIQDFEDTLEDLSKEKVVVLDLRGNGGGSWKTAQTVMKYLSRGKLRLERKITMKGEGSRKDALEFEGGNFKGKLYVLVDRRTLDEAYDLVLMLSSFAKIVGEEPGIGDFRFGFPAYKRLPSVSMFLTVSRGKIEYDGRLRIDVKMEEDFQSYVDRMTGRRDAMIEKLLKEVIM